MSDPTISTERLAPEAIRTLFLFESLNDEQLAWMSEQGRVEHRASGEMVYVEGEPATCFFVLLEGTIVLTRRVEGDEVEISRTNQRGVYGGAMQAYLQTSEPQTYSNSLQAITEASFFVMSSDNLATMVRTWFPMAMHLLEGLFVGMRNSQVIVGQRERLLGLGRLTAGLTHELNNPAAAAVRATSSLRERVGMMRHKLSALADGRLNADNLIRLAAVQEDAVDRLGKAPKLSPMEASDAEDTITDWMDDHGLHAGWEIAPTLVAAGVTTEWLDGATQSIPPEFLDGGLRWVAYTLETELLMNEIEDATHRISALVGAAKQYSQLDRAAHQEIDVRDGLDSTLVMLGGKLHGKGIAVVKDYAQGLPDIPAYAAELNQVWTNLIDNAIAAMAGGGTLTLRTALDGDHVLVEIGDTGPGVPPENLKRIFEPFFTTKPVGEGTGLGLDISYRIVVQRHRGDLRVVSVPGDTRFQVRLPINEPAADPD
jgi:signal transduction histidine kinase